MARRLKNRYKLEIGGLTFAISLVKSFTDHATDYEIAEEILIHFKYWNTLEYLRSGGKFDLKVTYKSKGEKNE